MIYTFFDIEANGLRRAGKMPEVLEVGYIQTDGCFKVLRGGAFYFFKPEWSWDYNAEKVHGLTRSFLSQYEDEYTNSLVKLWTLMEHGILIGKNSDAFDIPVCKNMFSSAESNLPAPTVMQSIDMQKVWAPVYKGLVQQHTGQAVKNAGTLGEYIMLIGWKQEEIDYMFNTILPGNESRCGNHGALYDAFMTLLVAKDAVHRGILKLEA